MFHFENIIVEFYLALKFLKFVIINNMNNKQASQPVLVTLVITMVRSWQQRPSTCSSSEVLGLFRDANFHSLLRARTLLLYALQPISLTYVNFKSPSSISISTFISSNNRSYIVHLHVFISYVLYLPLFITNTNIQGTYQCLHINCFTSEI